MVAGAMPLPARAEAAAMALGADTGLGRMGGDGIMQKGMTWLLRAAGGPARILIMGMLPSKMGDGTLHTDNQLRKLSHANTRVRFQFRRDAEGAIQIYGIHTGKAGNVSVPTVQVQWNDKKTALEAELSGITILWTPRTDPWDPLGTMPPLNYPDNSGAHLGNIMVHPIPEGIDSEIEGLPGEDITIEDRILVFPADTGLDSLYVVYAKPPGMGEIKYHPAPTSLPAFPDAVDARLRGNRRRWTSKKRIFEWDYQHGAVEVYDKQGNHLGEFDASTGEQTGKAKPERKITTN